MWFHDHLLGGTRLNVYAGIAGGYLLIDPPGPGPDPGLSLPAGLTATGLTGNDPLIPLVIQDRMFDVNGELFFPSAGLNLEHPFWVPEFVGDTICVNGKVWPWQGVDRKRYRFLLINGSNARTYDLSLIDRVSGVQGPRFWVIGTDGGYLDSPVLVDPVSTNKAVLKSLVMMPGERYDIIVDFNDSAWLTRITTAYAALGIPVPDPLNLVLRNTGKTPYPGGGPAPASTTGRILQFRVNMAAPGADASYNPATLAPIRTGTNSPTFDNQKIKRLVDPVKGALAVGVTPVKVRQMTLNEIMGMGGPLEVLVNNTKWSGESPRTYGDFTPITINGITTDYSEIPAEGATEVWEIINLTADAHPIHTHLTTFQLLNRQGFDVNGYNAAYAAAFTPPTPGGVPGFGPPLNYNTSLANETFTRTDKSTVAVPIIGGNPNVIPFQPLNKYPPIPPSPNEAGWKDTVTMLPGQVTRIVVRFAPNSTPVGGSPMYYPFNPNAAQHGYVWHCHIVDHEDNEMMRPYAVSPNGAAVRSYIMGTDY